MVALCGFYLKYVWASVTGSEVSSHSSLLLLLLLSCCDTQQADGGWLDWTEKVSSLATNGSQLAELTCRGCEAVVW